MFFKNETVFLHVLASPCHPQDNSLYISEGVQASTLLVIFLLYYDSFIHSFIHSYSIDHTDVEFVIKYKYKQT